MSIAGGLDRVSAARIGNGGELLIVFDEFLNEVFEILVVAIVVLSAVVDEEMSFQVFHVRHWRTIFVAFRIIVGEAHVSLLVDAVIEELVADESACHGEFVEIRIAE